MTKVVAAVAGGVAAAFASALCCAGPLIAVALGLSGAGLAAAFEPLRPYFVAGAALLLGSGFWLLRREERRLCRADGSCVDPRRVRRLRRALWVGVAVAGLLAAFPYWSAWVL